MKKFLLFISSLAIIYIAITILLRVVWIQTIQHQDFRNQLDSTKHTVVIGPSNGVYSWNDSILNNSVNLCSPGESFASSYYRLRWSVEYNRARIDTVILCASMPTFLYYTDSILNKDSRFLFSERSSMLYYDDFFQFNIRNNFNKYLKIALTTIPYENFAHNYLYEGYIKSDMGIGKNGIDDSENMISAIERLGSVNGLTEEYLKNNCKCQVEYVKRISDYCLTNRIQLVILCTPVHESYRQISTEGYESLMQELCNDNTLIADYSFMELDEKCYGDYEHLNTLGATVFSEYVRANGLLLRPIASLQ